MNCLEIAIRSATFKNGLGGRDLSAKEIKTSAEEETVTFVFPDKLPAGKSGILNIEFIGEINDKMKGFYRSKYSG